MTTKKTTKKVAGTTKTAKAKGKKPVAEATTGKSMVVGKIGWDNANEFIPMVLVDKRTRTELGLEIGDLVYVSLGNKKVIAPVNLQFWELVGTGKCTLNRKLVESLVTEASPVEVGTTAVKISIGVTEEEKRAFITQFDPRVQIAEALRRAMSDMARQRRQG